MNQSGNTTIELTDNNNTICSGRCGTASGTAAKFVDFHSYTLLAKSYLQILMINSNTAKSALTLNINNRGAKPIYINGSESSSSNYTLPAGTYLVYYDGTNFYFRTDGKITGIPSISVSGSKLIIS